MQNNRILFLLIIFLSCFTGIKAQKDSVLKYLDENLHFTTRNKAAFPAMAAKQGDHWVLTALYPHTSILIKIFFKDAALAIKDGPFTLYYQNSMISEEGFFVNNLPHGIFRSWYSDGNMKDSGFIYRNRLTGTWKYWYKNGRLQKEKNYGTIDSTAPPRPAPVSSSSTKAKGLWNDVDPEGELQGNYYSWYENGHKESVGFFNRDSMQGSWTWYREDETMSIKETYANGKVIDLACYNEKGEYAGSTCSVLKPPLLVHPFLTALTYIIDQLHRSENKDILNDGEVGLRFIVTKEGKIKDLVIEYSPDKALSAHIIKIFAGMPPWSPAVSHNRMLDYPMEMVVPFYR